MAAQEFLGTGLAFPILPDGSGGFSYVSGESNVQQSLFILLQTELGERVMRPDFGTELPRFVFFPGSVQNLRLIERSVRDAVRDWEPRVDLDDVRAELDVNDDTRVLVSVDYRVRRTNTHLNLVFPFYLDRAGGVQ